MCLLCGDAARSGHGVALAERPAHRLHGLYWQGRHAEAAAGSTQALLARVMAFSRSRTSLWKSPVVMLSWNMRPDELRCFAGFAPDDDEYLPPGFSMLDLPPMHFASSWHGPQDGDVIAHYGHMLEWMATNGRRRDCAHFDQREEYPPGIDPESQPGLRLLLPVLDEGR